MKLCEYVIGGTGVSELVSTSSLVIDDLGGNVKFVVIEDADPVPTDYQDISSIENWFKWGSEAGKDYKYIRAEIKTLVNATLWTSLSTEEKQIAARLFLVGEAELSEVFSYTEELLHGAKFNLDSTECRKVRYSCALAEVFYRFSLTNAHEVGDEVVSDNLAEQYIYQGVEGTESGNAEGLYDYLQGLGSYSGAGLINKTYTTRGGISMSDVVDNVMEFLKNGPIS